MTPPTAAANDLFCGVACVSFAEDSMTETMQASILLFDGHTLDAVRRIQCSATGFTCLMFTPDGAQLVAATADRSLAFFSTLTGEAQCATAYTTYTDTPCELASTDLSKPGVS